MSYDTHCSSCGMPYSDFAREGAKSCECHKMAAQAVRDFVFDKPALSAAPVAQEPVAWREATDIPPVKRGREKQFIVAVRRAHNGNVYSFAADYLNGYPLNYDDECPKGDGCDGTGCDDGCPTTGWFAATGDGADGITYNALLGKGDELVAWREVPKWKDRSISPATSAGLGADEIAWALMHELLAQGVTFVASIDLDKMANAILALLSRDKS